MPSLQKYVGGNTVVDSGSVVLGPDDGRFTVIIDNLTFIISAIQEPRTERLSVVRESHDKLIIKINTTQGGDLTFKFKVGNLMGRDLSLAIHLEAHDSYSIFTYTFSMSRP